MFGLGQNSRSGRAFIKLTRFFESRHSSSTSVKGGELFSAFVASESGNIAMIFGLTIAIIFGAVGGAIDYGRWLTARTQTQNAVDAAVLAAGRVLQSSGGNAEAAIQAARTY